MLTLENILLLFMIAGITFLMVTSAIWGFRDGRRRGRSGILVAMLLLWVFPFGALLWVLFRPDVVDPQEIADHSDEDLKRRANAGTL